MTAVIAESCWAAGRLGGWAAGRLGGGAAGRSRGDSGVRGLLLHCSVTVWPHALVSAE